MTILEHNPDRYSAQIDLWLSCEHGEFKLAQVGDTFVLTDRPIGLPKCEAWVHVKVDGQEFKRHVTFGGMQGDSCEATIFPNDGIPI
jgi:hypothetical protein